MITSLTNINGQLENDEAVQELYQELFALMSNDVSTHPTITTLSDYFENLPGCLKSSKVPEINKIKYLSLPLDEPTFKIDLNTRTITIPEIYFKSGIAVQGEYLADTLFFEVDRYFDINDLNYLPNSNKGVKIYIQWENQEGVSGVSEGILRQVKGDKLFFGWALDDNITKHAGIVNFSVRFLQLDTNNNVVLDLSTITTMSKIQPSLNIEPILVIDNAVTGLENIIKQRAQNDL